MIEPHKIPESILNLLIPDTRKLAYLKALKTSFGHMPDLKVTDLSLEDYVIAIVLESGLEISRKDATDNLLDLGILLNYKTALDLERSSLFSDIDKYDNNTLNIPETTYIAYYKLIQANNARLEGNYFMQVSDTIDDTIVKLENRISIDKDTTDNIKNAGKTIDEIQEMEADINEKHKTDINNILGKEAMVFFGENPQLQLIIDQGSAPPELISGILADLSLIYREMGGSGINFAPDGVLKVKERADV